MMATSKPYPLAIAFAVFMLVTAFSGCDDSTDGVITPTQIRAVLDIADALDDGGGYGDLAGTGVPKDIWFGNRRILSGSTDGTYCCGFTFAVMFDAATERGLIQRLSLDDVKSMQAMCYGATEAYAEKQIVQAFEAFGLGEEVEPKDAQPGDFVQYWRDNGYGHQVVFREWIKNNKGTIVGFRYRSSQPSTEGIGDHFDYFDSSGVEHDQVIDNERFYVGRLFTYPKGS